MADALVSAPVAATAAAASVSLIVLAANKVKHSNQQQGAAMMGVLGAFVFAAQMINFTIPGTGSSGHIIGGVLLSAMLGPWAAFITLSSVLIVQCLVFADGGLLALGCNIVNMAAMSCLVAYPLIYRPIAGHNPSSTRLMWASVLASIVGLELGAAAVTAETVLSGVTALPAGEMLALMLPIHLAIGACEGVATGLVLLFVRRRDPSLLSPDSEADRGSLRAREVLISFAVAALVLAVTFVWVASEQPDGLEWSIMKITGSPELASASVPATALMPDYGSHLSGLVGGAIVMVAVWAASVTLFHRRRV